MTPLYYALDWLYFNDRANYETFYAEAAYLSAWHGQINITHDNVKALTPETLFLLQADHGTLEKVIPLCINQFPRSITNLQRFEVASPLDLHAATLNLRDNWNSFILKLAQCLFSYRAYFDPQHLRDTFNQLNIYSLSLLSGLAPTHHLLMKTVLDEIAQIKLTKAIDVFSLVGSQTFITREDSLEKEAYHHLKISDHASTDELSAWQKIADLDVRGVDPTLRTPEHWATAFNALEKIGNNLGVAKPQIDKNPQYPSLTLRSQTPQGKLDLTITGQSSLPATNISFAIALTGPLKGLVQCEDPFMLLSVLSRKVTSPYLTNLYSLVQSGQLNIYHPEFHSSMVFFLKSMAQATATKYLLIVEQMPQIKELLSTTPQVMRSIFKLYQDKVVKENPQYENWLLNFFQQSFDKQFNAYLLEQWKNASNPVVIPLIELPVRQKKILTIRVEESASFKITMPETETRSFKIYPAVQATDFVESPAAKERRLAEELAMREKVIAEKAAQKKAEAAVTAQKKLAEETARKKMAEAETAQKKAAEEEIARQKAAEKEAARRHAEQEQQRKLEEQAEQRRLKALEKQKAQEEQQRREAKTAEERTMAEIQRKTALLEERKATDALLAQWKAEKKERKKTVAEIAPAKEVATAAITNTNISESANAPVLIDATATNKPDVPKTITTPAADTLIKSSNGSSLETAKPNKTKAPTNAPTKTSKNKSIAKKDDTVPVVAANTRSTTYWQQMRYWSQKDLRAATAADIRFAIASFVSITVASFIFHSQYTFAQQEQAASMGKAAQESTNDNSAQKAIMLFVSLLFTALLVLKIIFPRHMPSPTRLILNMVIPGIRTTPPRVASEANNPRPLGDNAHELDGNGQNPQKQKIGKGRK